MFVMTKQSAVLFLVAVLLVVVLVQLQAGFLPVLLTVTASAFVMVGVSLPIWAEHARRYDRLLEGLAVAPQVSTFWFDGLTPVSVRTDALQASVERALASSHRWWAVRLQSLPTCSGTARMALMTSGDTTVINFRPAEGPGYRVMVPTSDLVHVLTKLN
jgi:hypothetical protein